MRALLLALLLSLAASAEPLTLPEAYRRAVATSPTLQRLESRSQEALYKVDEASSQGNPRIDLRLGYTHLTPELSFGPYPLIVADNYAAGLTVEQAIHTFGRLKWSKEAARLAHQATEQEAVRERQRIAFETALAYSRLVTAREAAGVARQAGAAREALISDLGLRVKAGSSAPFEKLVAEVALAEDRQKILEAEQRESILRDRLLVRLGLPLDAPLELEACPPPPAELPQPSLEIALQQRPERVALQSAIEAARARVSLEESQSAPELGARTAFEARNSTAFQTGTQWSIGLQLRIPIYDGGLSDARTHQAEAALHQVELGGLELERQITLEVREAASHLKLSQERLAVARANVKQAEEAERLGKLRFQAGVGTHQEVLDVQAHASAARLALLEAQQALRESCWEAAWVTSQKLPFEENR